MKNRWLRWLSLLAALTVVATLTVQIYWITREFRLSEERFNQQVIDALTYIVNEIKRINHDPAMFEEPVRKVRSNYFIAVVNDTVHPFWLESSLKREFLKRSLTLDFEYMVYDCFTDSLIFGNSIRLSQVQMDDIMRYTAGIRWVANWHYFGVYFPNKEEFILGEMGVWLASSFVVFVVLLVYSYALFVFFRQKKLSDIKNDFISNMTHELKTPVSTIILSADVLKKEIGNENERARAYAGIIHKESKRLKDLIDNVLRVSLLDKKPELKNELLRLHPLIEEVSRNYEPILEKQQGKLELVLRAAHDKIYGDRIHLQNVLTNLLDNAIKYCDKTPEIVISTEDKNNFLLLSVKDNGPGVPPEYQKMIFDKFFRVPQGNVHNIKGYGLGLYYVKTVIKEMGGEIILKSKWQEGSEFLLYLPVKKAK